MTALGMYVQTIIDQGSREAQQDQSATVEAHHLLLAIAAGQEGTTHQVLTSAGLDHRAIRDALSREFERSLSAAGVSLAAFDFPPPSSPAGRAPRLGTSARLALERGFTSGARRKDLQPAHLLLGILQAQVGTVPRALALAGIDRADLVTRVLQALSSESEQRE
jgi:ATP-dependent Clp protease ATP-binding subunit ClpA